MFWTYFTFEYGAISGKLEVAARVEAFYPRAEVQPKVFEDEDVEVVFMVSAEVTLSVPPSQPLDTRKSIAKIFGMS